MTAKNAANPTLAREITAHTNMIVSHTGIKPGGRRLF
jgi:hypothetical protein